MPNRKPKNDVVILQTGDRRKNNGNPENFKNRQKPKKVTKGNRYKGFCKVCVESVPAVEPRQGNKPIYCKKHWLEYLKNRRVLKLQEKVEGVSTKVRNIERKRELILLGQEDHKEAIYRETPKGRRSGHNRTYDSMPEHIKFIIDCTALGYTPTMIVKMLTDKYGPDAEEVLSLSTIVYYRKTYIDHIMRREKELRSQIPILNPVTRMQYLNDVAAKGLMGQDRYTKDGEVYTVYDLGHVVSAVKEMNAMQKTLDEQKELTTQELREHRELEEQKQLILEHIKGEQARLKDEGVEKSLLELMKEVSEDLQRDYNAAFKAIEKDFMENNENAA